MNLFEFDNELRPHPNALIAGIDEAGRGSLAGPVVAACVILPPDFYSELINDSKQLTAKNREKSARIIKDAALAYSVAFMSHIIVDRYNILQATYKAMSKAFSKIKVVPDMLLIDGPNAPAIFGKQRCIVDGDAKSLTIAAASILAKVFRDKFMDRYHKFLPNYSFHNNKGYPTAKHRKALEDFGPCSIHRMSYAPVREVLIRGKN